MNCENLGPIFDKYPTEELYSYVIDHYSDVKKDNIKSYMALNNFDLLIVYKNNVKELFDVYNGYRRYIPYETDALTEEEHRKEFPRLLNKMIHRKNISQKEFAEKLGITNTMVSRYLSGKSLPGYSLLKKMAKVLDCTVDDLYLNF